jgi:hypothetical protein
MTQAEPCTCTKAFCRHWLASVPLEVQPYRRATNYDLLHGDDDASREELARRVRSFGNDPWWV